MYEENLIHIFLITLPETKKKSDAKLLYKAKHSSNIIDVLKIIVNATKFVNMKF